MKQELITEVMQQMLSYLDNAQMKQLRQEWSTLFNYEVNFKEYKPEKDDSNDLIEMFISAKRVEGCSEKTLKYYQTTIDNIRRILSGLQNVNAWFLVKATRSVLLGLCRRTSG